MRRPKSEHRTDLLSRPDQNLATVDDQTWVVKGQPMTTLEVQAHICEEVANGRMLSNLSKGPNKGGFPSMAVINRWRVNHPAFRRNLELAEQLLGEHMAAEAVTILDDVEGILAQGRQGVALAKERSKVRQWMAGKQNKKFADKSLVEHNGSVELMGMSEEQLKAKIAALLADNPDLRSTISEEYIDVLPEPAELICLPPEPQYSIFD